MRPYFSNPKRLAALKGECQRWAGTPFFAGQGREARPKVGADCVGLCFGILRDLGAIDDDFTWPRYVMGGGAAMSELLTDTLNSIGKLELIAFGQPDPLELMRPGDVGLILIPARLARASEGQPHLTIYEGDNRCWHSWPCCGVIEGNIGDPIVKRCARAIYRPVEI